MDSSDLINYFITQRGYRRYLEIGMKGAQRHFTQVHCLRKVRNHPLCSDDFFANTHEEFDVIFVDGFHTEEQVLKDINNAFQHLANGGVIVLHDCMPPDKWHQREPEAFQNGENWNGTVWKAALRIFNESIFKCSLLDIDWGCGLIDTGRRQLPVGITLPEVLEYPHHYQWLLEYKISVVEYFREQVKVIYHLACMGNWRDVFREQMLQLKRNGFDKVGLTVLGTESDLGEAYNNCSNIDLRAEVMYHNADLTQFEKPAMRAIECYAKEHDGYVLYLHSKGVSAPNDKTKVKWRRLMMKELVEQWKNCMSQLWQYDAVGVNWRDMPPTSHFCGNFWYASTSHLKKLATFDQYYDNPRYQIWDKIESKRLGCEFWISSANQTPRLLSLYCRNVDFCNSSFWIGR